MSFYRMLVKHLPVFGCVWLLTYHLIMLTVSWGNWIGLSLVVKSSRFRPTMFPLQRDLMDRLWLLFYIQVSDPTCTPQSIYAQRHSCLVPLHPGVCVSRVIASSSEPNHFDIKAEVCCFPLHAEDEDVMGEWPLERLVKPQDKAEPPDRSGQCIPLWLCTVKAEWPDAWSRHMPERELFFSVMSELYTEARCATLDWRLSSSLLHNYYLPLFCFFLCLFVFSVFFAFFCLVLYCFVFVFVFLIMICMCLL